MGRIAMELRSENVGQGRLVALVVTHNRLDQLRATLTRLCAEYPARLQAILVVDNASTDGTAGWLAGLDCPGLAVLRCDENRGGAGGFALGLREAVARFDPDWVVVMDDDARPAPGALTAFHQAKLTGWEAVAAAVYYPDGRICEINRPALNPLRGPMAVLRFLPTGRDAAHLGAEAFEAPPQPVDWASFVGLFLSREAIARAGFPDPRYFIYSDDVQYTLDLTEAGGRLGFFPQIRFEHDCSSLSLGSARRLTPLWKSYYYHRNQILLYRRLAGGWVWLLLPVLLMKWLMKLPYHKGAGREFLRLYGWAVLDGLRRDFGRSHDRIVEAGLGK